MQGLKTIYLNSNITVKVMMMWVLQADDAVGLLCPLTFCIVVFVLNISLATWVYKDAKECHMDGGLWAVIVIFLSFIGLILYLIIRNPKQAPYQYYYPPPGQPYQYAPPPPQARPQETPVPGGDPRIPKEKVVEVSTVRCSSCGTMLDADAQFCGQCGAPLR